MMFTVQDAVTATGASDKTIRRRLPDLQEHGATVDDRGRWSIPYSALVAAGFTPGKPAPPGAGGRLDQITDQVTSTFDHAKKAADQAEIQPLTSQNAVLLDRLAARDEVIAAKDQTIAAKDEVIAWARLQLPPGALEKPAPTVTLKPAAEVDSGGLEAVPVNVITTEPAATEPVHSSAPTVTLEPAAPPKLRLWDRLTGKNGRRIWRLPARDFVNFPQKLAGERGHKPRVGAGMADGIAVQTSLDSAEGAPLDTGRPPTKALDV